MISNFTTQKTNQKMSAVDEDLTSRMPLVGFFLHFNNKDFVGSFREALASVLALCAAGRFMHPDEAHPMLTACETRA